MKNNYVIEYLNESVFKIKERVLKKYNMLAYKKLMFDYYPGFREGNFRGIAVSKNDEYSYIEYELVLPTDAMFSKIHKDIILHYTVYEKQKIVMLTNITPDDIFNEGHHKNLTTYKGVLISKSHAEKDMFKINLLNIVDGSRSFSRSIKTTKIDVKDDKKKISKKEDKKTTEKNRVIDYYLFKWQREFNSKDDTKKLARDIVSNIENLLDNSFDNMDYYKKKFNDFIIVYLNKCDGSFLDIRNYFIKYLLRCNKDEVFKFNVGLLEKNIKFDLCLMSWINDLVDSGKIIKIIDLVNDDGSELYFYKLNRKALTKNEENALNNNKKYLFVWLIILFFLVVGIYIFKEGVSLSFEERMDNFIIYDNLNNYEGDIFSYKVSSYLKDRLEKEKYNVSELVDLIYTYRNIVFVDKSTYGDEKFYIQMSDSFYNEFINRLDDEYDQDSDYYKKYSDVGSFLCDANNSMGGISYLDNYRIEYFYDMKNYKGMSYYIYYYDNTLLERGFVDSFKCGSSITPISILEDYNKKYNNYEVSYGDRHIKVNLEDKIITFYDNDKNIEFNLYTYSGYLEEDDNWNVITLEWE